MMLSFVVLDENGVIQIITSELDIACHIAQFLEDQGHRPRVELLTDW